MADTDDMLSSPSWHRVARLKPRIRAHIDLHRHGFRDQIWYVLEDRTSGRYFRFSSTAYRLIDRMDGATTVDTIWRELGAELGKGEFTRDDLVSLLSQLHRANVLHGDTTPDIDELVDRTQQLSRKKELMRFLNPLAIKVPLLDPERFIAATFPLVRPLYTRVGFLLILCLIAYGALQASIHWVDLTGNLLDRVLTFQNFALLLIAYPFIKLFHELGHAYAIKRWGGETHELGVMMLVLMPVPYVDASAAAAFPSKWARAVVGSAGIFVELTLAAIALLIWIEIEPGLFRALLFNFMLIGGVSTLLFNGNPLLRFDGYYVLSDILEIPNLGQRSNRYIRYLAMNRLFGAETVKSPVTAPGEAFWFGLYAPAALIYRLFIMAAIVFFVAGKFFFIGIALAIWAVVLMYLLPIFKAVRALFFSPDLRGCRTRAITITGLTLATITAAFSLVPVPFTTIATGVVNPGKDAQILAQTSGFVVAAPAPTDAFQPARVSVVTLQDPFLKAREATLRSDLAEIESRLRSADVDDRAEALILRERRGQAKADLARAAERANNLIVRSSSGGTVVVPGAADLPGQFLRQGQVVGYAVDPDRFVVDVVIPEARVDLLQPSDRIHMRLASNPSRAFEARLLRETPSAIRQLPNAALSTLSGGPIVTDPSDQEGLRTLNPTFQVELKTDVPLGSSLIGQRVFVRFDHGSAPLAKQIYRGLRQIFLERFNV